MAVVRYIGIYVICCLLFNNLFAQCPVTADFTFPDDPYEVCLQEPLLITDQSSGSPVKYDWDFCVGDLLEIPTATSLLTISGTQTPTGVDIFYDGTNWYGFVSSRTGMWYIGFCMVHP